MKTDKEYPATHSMDTVWFVSDLDGNVAIFQFMEDGPGPIPSTDIHSDVLISLLDDKDSEIAVMPFTKEQIDELKTGLKPVSSIEDIKLNCNIIFNPAAKETLIRAGGKFDLCYSEEEGFYHLEYWEWDLKNDAVITELIEKGEIYGAQECDIEIYFEDNRDDQSKHRLAHFPFYVYKQSLCINYPPERVVVPKYPMKVEQVPEKAREYMFSLPVRFAEKELLEPAEFVDSQCWIFNNHTKEVNGVKYMQVALTDGGFGYVKVVPYGAKVTEQWKAAPRVIDKGDEYIDIE